MDWYYAEAGQQRGPVNDAEFEKLVQGGTIRGDTLVWRDGMANWQPYAEAVGRTAEAPPATPASPAAGEVVCWQCGKIFKQDEVVRLGDAWVCAACKPVFLQRIREGASPSPARTGLVSEAELLARDYDLQIGSYLGRGWELYKVNPGMLVVASILAYLPILAANLIPYLGVILVIVLTGPLVGGLWLLYIKRVRGEDSGIAEAFGGFGPRFGQLVFVSVVSTVLNYLCIIPGIMILVTGFVGRRAALRGGGIAAMNSGLTTIGVIFLVVGFLALIYLAISWMFAFPLIIDKRLGFWAAMGLSRRVVGKHFWSTLLLAIVVSVLAVLGVLVCLVGFLVTGPLGFMVFAQHYDRVFGDLAPVEEISGS